MKASLHAYRLICSLEGQARRFLGYGRALGLEESVCFGWPDLAASRSRSLVLFVGTIGEFNAVRSLINAYRERWPDDRLVLLTGQEQYADPLHKAIPDSIIALPTWRSPRMLDRFLALAQPRLVAFAEGPSLHGRFPIRLELPLPAACLYHGLPLVVLNARVYERHLPSRIDRLENIGFAGLHRDAVSRWFVPDASTEEELRRAGAPAPRISMVGDLKFDNAASEPEVPPAGLAGILEGLAAQGGEILVGGSVNELEDQISLIEGWRELRQTGQDVRLIIAPRYLQFPHVLRGLRGYLEQEGLSYQLRSEIADKAPEADVFIIDVFGELRFYYGISTLCYVGHNHGVLEPLRYGKPTVVADDWRRDHPSFPLYDKIVKAGAVVHVKDKSRLGEAFIRILRDSDYTSGVLGQAAALISQNAGAAQRIMDELQETVVAASQ